MRLLQTTPALSRRRLLQAGAATVALMPLFGGRAQAAGYVRANITSPEGQQALATYAAAIDKMLKLPPEDPLNWYRQAMIHVLDCPHGNWWFLPWHRGYLWYFESIIRTVSGNSAFALPYWDWTATPYIPPSMWQGVLTPTNDAYLPNAEAFKIGFTAAVDAFWADLTPEQKYWMNLRQGGTIQSAEDLMNLVLDSFVDRDEARGLTPQNPQLNPQTQAMVSLDNLTQSVLAPLQFESEPSALGFGSYRLSNHDQSGGKGPLESQPHDNVHDSIDGFMGMFMSPVDPIFYLHHANVDRIWTVWTNLQVQAGLPILPTDSAWENEQFAFFVDAGGNKVQSVASDWKTTVDYTYSPGSGSDYVRPDARISSRLSQGAVLASAMVGSEGDNAASASADLPDMAEPVSMNVTITVPADPTDTAVLVFVNAPDLADNPTTTNPGFLTTISFFGLNHGGGHGGGSVTVQVPIPKRLVTSGLITAGGPINIQLVSTAEEQPDKQAADSEHAGHTMLMGGQAPGVSQLLGVQVLL